MKKIKVNPNFQAGYLHEGKVFLNRRIREHLNRPRHPYLKELKSLLLSKIDDILIGDLATLISIKRTMKTLEKKYNPGLRQFEVVENIFSYKLFKSKSTRKYFGAYQLHEHLKLRVCPYCDENFIFANDGRGGRRSKGPFDHYFPKSQNPYFAISLYNLVPSCGSCNSLKSDFNSISYALINPFTDEIDSIFEFNILFHNLANFRSPTVNDFTLDINQIDFTVSASAFKRFARVFDIINRYNSNHRGFICTLINLREKIENQIKPKFPGYNNAIIRESFFNTESPHYLHSPLWKLEKDFLRKNFP